jgi:glycerol-3-phosphate dehydrogenase
LGVTHEIYDLLVIGGGINGVSIARDAAGRGLSVLLCEMGDLAGATSSASSKLIHGGLRYLEQYAFRLVAESLRERRILLRNAPHVIRPMEFVLPHVPALRPAWMIGIGLWLYDRLGGRHDLPRSHAVSLGGSVYGAGLKPALAKGFVYSDCWVDDARFVVLTAVDAVRQGAEIHPRTRCSSARRQGDVWRAVLASEAGRRDVTARALVNAAGPWVEQVIQQVAGAKAPAHARLVKGSHIVVPRVHDGAHAMILQNDDGRIIFVIPYEGEFSLIGTTDVLCEHGPQPVEISEAEIDYLCAAVNRYLARAIGRSDVVWSYAGVRPLYDDGKTDPSTVTRDYVLALDVSGGGAPLLSVFGGKITTARKLAEHALEKLALGGIGMGAAWTETAPLPGGEMDSFAAFLAALRRDFAALDPGWIEGLARRHGTRARAILEGVRTSADLGPSFGGGLYGREVEWLRREEWALDPADILWRRTKCGLHMTAAERAAFAGLFRDQMASSRSG